MIGRASAALGDDSRVARREIQRALHLLAAGGAETDGERRVGQALASWQARRVLDHVHANLDGPMRVDAMARLTGLSTSAFFRAFKRSFGMSPHAYVVDLRLARARHMLLAGDEPISAVAAACGFADQAHLSRVFRRVAGCAPGVWRREQQSLAGAPLHPQIHPGDIAFIPHPADKLEDRAWT